MAVDFEVCFLENITNIKQGFVALSDGRSGPNKTCISACLAGTCIIKAFSLRSSVIRDEG